MDLKRKWRLAYAKGKRCTEAGTAANMYDQVGRNDELGTIEALNTS